MKDGFKKCAQAPVRRQMFFSVEVGVAVGMWFRIVFFSPTCYCSPPEMFTLLRIFGTSGDGASFINLLPLPCLLEGFLTINANLEFDI